MKTINPAETSSDEASQPQTEQDNNETRPGEVEKGSGYGPPNAGSGESVAEENLSPDGKPIPGAGTDADQAAD